ncbi:MAG: YARHG domain-containing protein [Bacteroidetes bacterium]|nr:MAG: YARHG domain-containing protein [Bacteroidota bacterium]
MNEESLLSELTTGHTDLPIPLLLLLVVFILFPAFIYATDPPARDEEKVEQVVRSAASYMGTPYKLGGLTRKGIDCSGLMMVSFAEAGHQLPRVSRDQALTGIKVDRKDLQRGDLIFFRKGSRISHVAMVVYADETEVKFIHSCVSQGVTITSLSNSYYNSRFHSARRIWNVPVSSPTSLSIPNPALALADTLAGDTLFMEEEMEEFATARPAAPGIYPEAALRALRSEDIQAMSAAELRLMKYEILARHGFRFPEAHVQQYFETQSWYGVASPTSDREEIAARLSAEEKANLELLSRMETAAE